MRESMHRHLYNFLLDRAGYELRFVVNIKFSHEIEFVRLHGLDTHPQYSCDASDGIALGKQFHYFPFARGQRGVARAHVTVLATAKVVDQLAEQFGTQASPTLVDFAK